MVEILDSRAVRRRAMPISVAMYHRMVETGMVDRKTELIRGVLFEKVSKTPLHSFLSKTLFALVLRHVPRRYHVQREDPLTLAASEPEPDIAVVPGKASDYIMRHPTTAKLVIEVCVSSGRLDRELAGVYAEAGVEEYWIVLAHKRAIEVYRRPVNGIYQERKLYRDADVLKSAALPGLEAKPAALFPPRK